jgi:hypothetical protein
MGASVKWPGYEAFKPTFSQQAAFCSDPARFVVADAAVRTGKTYSAMRKFVGRVRAAINKDKHRLKTFWLIAPTHDEGIAQKIELVQLLGSQVDARKQRGDNRWRDLKHGRGKVWVKGNALIEFKSADRPEGLVARKVDGVGWTEIARSKYAAWPNVRSRLANTMGWLIADTSPLGHNWAYIELIKPGLEKKLPGVSVHKWTAVDSPHIPREEIESARLSLPKAFFERDYMASDDVFMGQIYDLDEKIHLRDGCPFAADRCFVVADVNTTSTHPAEFIWGFAAGHGITARAHIAGCYQKVIGLDYDVYASDLAAVVKAQPMACRFVIDPSFHNDFKDKLRQQGLMPWNADNEILKGVRTLGSMLMPLPGIGPRLTFAKSCKPVFDQLRSLKWTVSPEGIVKPMPDKTTDDGWADCCRYMAMDLHWGTSFKQVR